MVRYHRQRYLPANAFFVLSGDFDSEAVLETINGFASDLPKAPLV